MQKFEYRRSAYDSEALIQTSEFMRICFPEAKHFTPAFLTWLYTENPAGNAIGHNVFVGEQMIGHVVGIPQNVYLHGRRERVVLLLNVATHPDYRGKGLFLQLARKLVELARDEGYAAITGVANKNTYRGYEKLGWQNVAGLDAYISMAGESFDSNRATESVEFYRDWDDVTLRWRMQNPENKLVVSSETDDHLVVQGATPYPILKVRSIIPRLQLAKCGVGHSYFLLPAVCVGLQPEGAMRYRAGISIPRRIRPSPLRLVYTNVRDPKDRLDPGKVLFSFLDFDAF